MPLTCTYFGPAVARLDRSSVVIGTLLLPFGGGYTYEHTHDCLMHIPADTRSCSVRLPLL
jgi:hypothetical protein